MITKYKPTTVSKNNFYAVDAETVQQTIQESVIEYCIDMGSFNVLHGTRDGNEIVIVEHHSQQADELSAIWFNENK